MTRLSIPHENIPTDSHSSVCSPFIFSFSFKANPAHKQIFILNSAVPWDVGTVESVMHLEDEQNHT